MKNLSAIISLFGVLTLGLWACGAKKIPRFDRPIYALDNLDPNEIKLRYKYDQEVVAANDVSMRGGVCFRPDDFVEFTKTYIAGCKEWDPSLELVDSDTLLKEKK